MDSTQSRRPLKKRKPNDTCDLPDCDASFVARGMCRKHYVAWYRATPKQERTYAPGMSRFTVAERFHAKVDRGTPDECWPFTGTRHGFGHGQFFVSKKRGLVPAHAFALELAEGRACPTGMEACHHCDNPPCCNPAHLYFGTRQQNVDDMWRRGRAKRGSQHSKAQLTEASVVQIRERYKSGEQAKSLAVGFGVRETTITAVVLGKNWKHVGGPIHIPGSSRGPRFIQKRSAA